MSHTLKCCSYLLSHLSRIFFFWARYFPLQLTLLKFSQFLVEGTMDNWGQTFGPKTQNLVPKAFLGTKISRISEILVFLRNGIVQNLLEIQNHHIQIKNFLLISSQTLLKFQQFLRDENLCGFEPWFLACVRHDRIWNLFGSPQYLV